MKTTEQKIKETAQEGIEKMEKAATKAEAKVEVAVAKAQAKAEVAAEKADSKWPHRISGKCNETRRNFRGLLIPS